MLNILITIFLCLVKTYMLFVIYKKALKSKYNHTL